jgi:hypothetical protein
MTPRDDIRLVPTAALTITAIALLAFVLQYPTAALWAVVVALVLAVLGLFTLAKESIDLRAEGDDKDRHIEALEDAVIDRDETIDDLTAALAEATATPTQPPGEHDRLALSREEWAAIEHEMRDL